MTDQIIIDFPELDQETYERLLKISRDIKVRYWVSDERKYIPLKWNGTRICCPITLWFDFPEELQTSNKSAEESE